MESKNGKYVSKSECILQHSFTNEKLDDIKKQIQDIENNHIEHLNKKMDELDSKIEKMQNNVAKYAGMLAGALVVIEILIRFIK